MTDAGLVRRIARQHLETTRLLGVDFVPRGHAAELPEPHGSAEVHSRAEEETQRETVPVQSTPKAASAERPAPRAAARSAEGATRSAATVSDGALRPLAEYAEAEQQSSDSRSREEALRLLNEEHARECPHCTTASGHTRLVFGEGNPHAELMFVGEAPGETEDQTGRPFVGRAGQKLEDILKAMGLRREDVYIANVLKARPPENRTPLQPEIERCGPYLVRQIRIIRPKVVVTLGGPATKLLTGSETGITRMRGIWTAYVDHDLTIPLMPTFHPAYLLRNYTPETRKQVWSDMQAVMGKLRS